MKIERTLIAILSLAVILSGCGKYMPPRWNIGDWVEYEVRDEGRPNYNVRYAITGIERIKGKTYYWLEMTESGMIIYKMLVPYGYRGPAKRMIIKFDKTQAIEMPDSLNEEPDVTYRPYLLFPREIRRGKQREERLTVAKDTIEAIRVMLPDPLKGEKVKIELWFNNKVPILGIVARVKKKGSDLVVIQQMKVTGWGKGAVTAIKEEPVKVNPLEKMGDRGVEPLTSGM